MKLKILNYICKAALQHTDEQMCTHATDVLD